MHCFRDSEIAGVGFGKFIELVFYQTFYVIVLTWRWGTTSIQKRFSSTGCTVRIRVHCGKRTASSRTPPDIKRNGR